MEKALSVFENRRKSVEDMRELLNDLCYNQAPSPRVIGM